MIRSSGLALAAHLARPLAAAGRLPGLVLCHGFPSGAATAGQTLPEFAHRLAAEVGWAVLAFNFRGTGASEGDFSLRGWLDDVRAAVSHLLDTPDVAGVWLAGWSVGGSLALCEAGADERVRGVASLAAPAGFGEWASDAKGLLAHARSVGAIRDPSFPPDVGAWSRELGEIRPLAMVGAIPPRPILVVHGDHDDEVPVDDARSIADAAGGEAELRIVNGAGHHLRHDPRAVAVLLGWLERQQLEASR